MIEVLIGIIVVAVLVYVGIVAYQRYLLRQIGDLADRRDEISESSVSRLIQEVSQLRLTGSSADGLAKLKNDYTEIVNTKLPEVDEMNKHAKQDVSDMKIFEARKGVTAMTDALDAVEEDNKRIGDQLTNIQKVDQDHRDAVKILKMKYDELRKNLLAQSLVLGPSIDQLEDNLSKLDSDYNDVTVVVESGDHEKADHLLKQLQTNTDVLEQQIKDIPPLYDSLSNVYPDQLAEIRDGYEQLINHNYAFRDDDIKADIRDVTDRVGDNSEVLANLRLDAVRDNNKLIEARIDDLYSELQTEIDARKEVDENFNVITEFITHAEKQNKVLLQEIERVNQSYALENDEANKGQELNSQLESIRSEHDRDTEQITNQPVIYSEILERLQSENTQLQDIEEQQTELNSQLQALVISEKESRERLGKYENEIHNIKRHVENLNLPGMPNDYMDFFFVVSDEIEKVGESMNQVRINTGTIKRELDMVETDLQTLTKKTTETTDSAALSESAIQYANRYRHIEGYEDVDIAWQRAQKLFDTTHQYKQSLETISAALDKAEPGAMERINEEYFQNKNTEY